MSRAETPDIVAIPRSIGIVRHEDMKAVGIQYIDQRGVVVFVAMPGTAIPALGQAFLDEAARHPEILSWRLPQKRGGSHTLPGGDEDS